MWIGDEPPLFLFEIAFRTTLIYGYTLLLIRWIGSRSMAQLSLVEFLLVIALGSAVGDAMFYPDVPLIHCMVVITVVVLLDKGLSFAVARYPRLEDAIEGRSVEVVRNGVIDCHVLRKLNFGHDELFEQLRLKDVSNVGQVRAAYVETNGMVSAFKRKSSKGVYGLSIDPPWDVSPPVQFKVEDVHETPVLLACSQCGSLVIPTSKVTACAHCKSRVWHRASQVEETSVLEGTTMAKKLKPGEEVEWNTSQGKTQGKVVRKQTVRTAVKDHPVAATKDDPQYMVKSNSSGKLAAHKAQALKKR